jgi:AcrR family transcriptional regulator
MAHAAHKIDPTELELDFEGKKAPLKAAPIPANRKGRPRSENSRKAILKATNSLLLHMSVQELSIEAIAKKAKVGKTTIYRWWPNKTAVVMDALVSQPGIQSPLPTPKNNADAIVMQLDKLIRLLDSKNGETISQLFSEAQSDATAHDIFARTFLTPLLDAIEFSVEEGQKAGEFRKSLDKTLAVDVLCGPIFFRLMARPAEMNEEFRETYPKEAVRLISA